MSQNRAGSRGPSRLASPMALRGFFWAPQLFEPAVASAGIAVVVVTNRILDVILLVILLGRPEFRPRDDFSDDLLIEPAGALDRPFRVLGEPLLRVVGGEDRGAILIAVIAELRVCRQRIDVAPEQVEQVFIGDLRGIEHDAHRFGVAGAAGRYFFIGRILLRPAGVAGGDRDDAVDAVEHRLPAPEAAPGADRRGGARRPGPR